ncbi:hypothetical protein L484_014882 [Morus notabilis]|uniref:Uncharacterized protein n=2 Tax=Morus notabilis TaxID=981085 RepID=W9SA45_9ROSA|nr:hypothetical protein L484_014882 [Morus notabilis]
MSRFFGTTYNKIAKIVQLAEISYLKLVTIVADTKFPRQHPGDSQSANFFRKTLEASGSLQERKIKVCRLYKLPIVLGKTLVK